MELMADSQDEDYGYQFSLVQIDGKDYPQLSQPIRHELPNFFFWSDTLHLCSSTDRWSQPSTFRANAFYIRLVNGLPIV